MLTLGFPEISIDNARLAVSELATNAFRHAHAPDPRHPPAAAELAAWARLVPRPQLMVSVFDLDRRALPRSGDQDLLAESGRGMEIVEAVTTGWGAHPSRSRLLPHPQRGKAVWMALPLPASWPTPIDPIFPAVAAQRLAANLAARGIPARRLSTNTGLSLVTAASVQVMVCPDAFLWSAAGTDHRHPLIDLQEASERVVETLERIGWPTPN
ncbi:ATP-binding protein [Actinomadura hibisca]|uniref:ATP-binding protein n=1 Tax=Actinomadura hibisca TaxID=68565 RepID=UPI000832E20C|nr:ATP-binding protein [Actinomadura hibisca]